MYVVEWGGANKCPPALVSLYKPNRIIKDSSIVWPNEEIEMQTWT
jgi:hypothetical protein